MIMNLDALEISDKSIGTIESVEVKTNTKRRRLSVSYKLSILRRIDELNGFGIGEFVRSEGLYQSQVSLWRKQYEQGTLMTSKPGRPRQKDESAKLKKKLRKLEVENQRLKGRLARAELINHVQKKVSEILGVELPPPPPEKKEKL